MATGKQANRKKGLAQVVVWVPAAVVEAFDLVARRNGRDRSKEMRVVMAQHAGVSLT